MDIYFISCLEAIFSNVLNIDFLYLIPNILHYSKQHYMLF
jgi:hypothetical protein